MKKIFKRSVWCLLSIFFALLFITFQVGGDVAKQYDSYINDFLGVTDYEIVQTDEGEVFNEYTSDYLNEDGSFNDKAMRNNSIAVATQTATEGSVLLENKDNALPLAKGSNISFFGISSAKYLFSAAGSGHLNVSVTTTLLDACYDNGLNVNPTLTSAYRVLSSQYGNYLGSSGSTLNGVSIGDNCYVEYAINEAPWDQLNKTTVGNVTSTFSDYGDAALLIISRNDGEDGDTNYYTDECIDGNYLDLAHEEVTILENLIALKEAGTFKKVMLLINAAQPMQMKNISKYDLDAVVWLGVGGNVSYEQIALIISGNANPSGHLIDTYAYDNYSAPSSVNIGDFTFATTTGLPATTTYSHNDKYLVYAEGVYVGYRYYETRYEDTVLDQGNATDNAGVTSGEANWDYNDEVAYPFGYGLSYTTFEQSDFSVSRGIGGYNVSVKVTNTGSVNGKDAVQVYLQKPYTDYDKTYKIEKPAVELVGFAKTKELAPNESETVTIFVKDEAFKSYDSYNAKTYIVEAGNYYLAAGYDVHDALNNILAMKGYSVSNGMDSEGNSAFSYRITMENDDFETYAVSTATKYPITNQFDDADPVLYEGTKDQFESFSYLSRQDWENTYPEPVVMDCVTERMIEDFQYVADIEEDPDATMPTFGASGSKTLISMWGYSYDDPLWDDLLDQVTWEEAVTLATYGGGTAGCVSVSAPNALAKDGPGGIGVANETMGNIMCFPSECNMAATFNIDLINDLGNAFGMEILHVGYTGIYGPGANIHRSSYSGRNWEYYSEDPMISSAMLASEVEGLQSRGVIVFTKHFLLNDQERNRYGGSVWANEQSIREIYLRAFEGGVVDGNMNGIMSSFNRIGAYWAGKHKGLLTEVLRNEWGFVGVVQTDAYVGTHMHQPLAESIVAGNDFTMGGSNPTALDAYKDNATVATALRETVHRILYTKLHSNVMNGLTLSSKIVYHTPWWKTTLTVGAYVMLSIMIACLLMFVTSLLIPPIEKKKERLESLPEYQGKKVKVFFDVINKTTTIVASCVVAALIVTGIAVPVGITLSKNSNSNINNNSGNSTSSTDVIEEETCDHVCYTCGYCIDYSSTLEACKTKCGENLTNTQTFEAEDSHVLRYAGKSGAIGIASETDRGTTETYIGGYNANLGAQIKYVFDCEEATTATLFVNVCKRKSQIIFANNVLVNVNGTLLQSRGIVPTVSDDEDEWTTFTDVGLGCIQLVEGRNYISFTVANDDANGGFNFNKITIKSDIEISWYEGEHICDDICPDCGLCQNEECDDDVCSNKCTCDLDQHEFPLSDDQAEITNIDIVDGVATFNEVGQSITYKIKSWTASNVTFFLNVAGLESDTLASKLFSITLNGTALDLSKSTLDTRSDYTAQRVALTNMPYGHNTIVITSLTATTISLNGITLGCNDDLDYVDPYEFLVTSDYVTVEGDAYKSSEYCVAMNENAAGSTITFPINSSEATTADLYLNLASRGKACKVSDILAIRVNGTTITTDADRPTTGSEFFTYSDVYINNVSLINGYNEIVIEVLNNDATINTNLRYISFKETTATLSFDSDSTLANRTIIEAEATTITAYNYNGTNYPYITGGQSSSGDYYLGGVNDAGLYGPGQAKLTFTLNASSDYKAKFYFNAGVPGSAKASGYTVYVGDTAFTSNQNWSGSGWYDWSDHYFGRIQLYEGDNVVTVVIENNQTLNLDYFLVESSIDITFVS